MGEGDQTKITRELIPRHIISYQLIDLCSEKQSDTRLPNHFKMRLSAAASIRQQGEGVGGMDGCEVGGVVDGWEGRLRTR